MKNLALAAVLVLTAVPLRAQHAHSPMGFDQARATHHFVLTKDGGRIEIDANDPADTDTRDRIATHLASVSAQFKAGDFSIPRATHAELPRGAAEMAALKAEIDYDYVASPAGGRVRIVARTPAALDAVHAFLRYQIEEHKTGDPLIVRR